MLPWKQQQLVQLDDFLTRAKHLPISCAYTNGRNPNNYQKDKTQQIFYQYRKEIRNSLYSILHCLYMYVHYNYTYYFTNTHTLNPTTFYMQIYTKTI